MVLTSERRNWIEACLEAMRNAVNLFLDVRIQQNLNFRYIWNLCLLITSCCLSNYFVTPAFARIEHEQAFNLCISQPLLQTDALIKIIEGLKSTPHDPALDEKTPEELINAMQFYEGNNCAKKLVSHPDVYSAIGLQQFSTKDDWILAWSAFNITCSGKMTGKCILDEIASRAAVRQANDQGQTAGSRVCQLGLGAKTSFSEWKKCMDAVGDQHPDEQVIRDCALSVEWGSQTDGAKLGRKLGQCLRRSK